MTGAEIVASIVEIMTAGLTGMAKGIGLGISEMVQFVFFNASGQMSVLATLVFVFAGISLALGLTRWGLNFITSIGSRNR